MSDDGIAWVTIYRSTSGKSCRERSLVLQAVGIAHGIRQEAEEFVLLVSAADAERGRAELDAYATENPDGISSRPVVVSRGDGWFGVLAYAAVLLITAVLTYRHAFGADWFAAGKTNAGLIRHGEWWRTMTALTLHADGARYLVANLVIGGLVGLFAGQALGSGLAWFSILISGAAGNLLNAWMRPAEHTSVGASTAVFAALGLLAANAWRGRRQLRTPRMDRWAPLVGGVLLLSYLGTGGGRTDVAAHVMGFLCGIPAGAIGGKLAGGKLSARRAQGLFGLATMTLVVTAWALALGRHEP